MKREARERSIGRKGTKALKTGRCDRKKEGDLIGKRVGIDEENVMGGRTKTEKVGNGISKRGKEGKKKGRQ